MPRQARPPAAPPAARPARQHRSARTRDRILDAAESLLERGGPDGATVPAIASAAGVAVGSVYRRFVDKEAVLRGVYQRFLNRGLERNRGALTARHLDGLPLAQVIRFVTRAMVRGYQQEASLLAALIDYAERYPDSEFRSDMQSLRQQTFAALERLLLARRTEITHPRPEKAIAFFLTTSALVLKGVLLHGNRDGIAMPADDVARELELLALGYLTAR